MSQTIPTTDMELIKRLWPLNRVHNSDDFDLALRIIQGYLRETAFRGEVKIHEYPCGREYNYWIVPKKWIPRKCILRTMLGKTIVRLKEHPLVLVPFSDTFNGTISRDELFKHLHFLEDMPDAIPYIFRKQYRHWEKGWGIALPYKIASTLKDAYYKVEIETEFVEANMKLLEYTLQGSEDKIITLCGHLDHPGQCNDSLTGVVSSLDVVKNLENRFKKTRYTYKTIICTEIIGSAIYLDQNRDTAAKMKYALCPNMLGHDAKFALSLSKAGNSRLDRAMQYVLTQCGADYTVGFFHKFPDCGDEISFDAPGMGIPTTTLSRIGELYKQYHTSLDTPEQIDPIRFRQAVAVMTEALAILEQDYFPQRTFIGNPCLSNPKLNLYLEPRNIGNLYNKASELPGFRNIKDPTQTLDPRLFMEFFISNLEGKVSLLDISHAFGVPFEFVWNYAEEFFRYGMIAKSWEGQSEESFLGPHLPFAKVSAEDSGVLFNS